MEKDTLGELVFVGASRWLDYNEDDEEWDDLSDNQKENHIKVGENIHEAIMAELPPFKYIYHNKCSKEIAVLTTPINYRRDIVAFLEWLNWGELVCYGYVFQPEQSSHSVNEYVFEEYIIDNLILLDYERLTTFVKRWTSLAKELVATQFDSYQRERLQKFLEENK